jgi:hypothetical protein
MGERDKSDVGQTAWRALRALAAGAHLTPDGEDWRIGTQAVRDADVAALARHDLVERDGTGGYRASTPGRSWLARLDAPDAPNRLLARTAASGKRREAAMRGARSYNRAEEPLAWLFVRRKISERQFAAGERLRRDFLMAAKGPRLAMDWEAGPVTRTRRGPVAPTDPTPTQICAKTRLNGALAAAGAGLSDVLTRTVCLGEGLETAERAMGWPARAGKVVLCLGLDRIADYYRLPPA